MKLHYGDILEPSDLGKRSSDIIEDCNAGVDVSDAVAFWREELGFTVDPGGARRFLRGMGAWDDEALAGKTPDELAEIVLWIACGDFAERDPDGLAPCFCMES